MTEGISRAEFERNLKTLEQNFNDPNLSLGIIKSILSAGFYRIGSSEEGVIITVAYPQVDKRMVLYRTQGLLNHTFSVVDRNKEYLAIWRSILRLVMFGSGPLDLSLIKQGKVNIFFIQHSIDPYIPFEHVQLNNITPE